MEQKFCKNCNQEIKREHYKALHFFNVAVYCSRQCFNAKTSKPKIQTQCPECGKDVLAFPSNKRKFCSMLCQAANKVKEAIGSKTKVNGYVLIRTNSPRSNYNGYEFEHRLIVEQHLKRLLEKHEVVHHINGIKDDNRIENLIVLTQQEHRILHSNDPSNYFKLHGKEERKEQLEADKRAAHVINELTKIRKETITIITP